MSTRAPDSARNHCNRASGEARTVFDRTSDSLQRAAEILEQSAKLRKSVARIRVGSSIPPAEPPRPTPSVVLIRGADGVLRVKKD